MRENILKLSVLVVILALAAHADSVSLAPCGCGDDAPAIQQAISQATQGGTVPGTVTLNGTFTLQGSVFISVPNLTLQAGTSGGAIAAPGQTAFVLLAGSDGLTVRGLTIQARRGLFTQSSSGIQNVTLSGNTFDTVTRGVSQFDGNSLSTGWVVRNNTFLVTDTSACDNCVAVLVTGINGVVDSNSIQYYGRGEGIVVQNNHGSPGVTSDGGSGWSVQNNTVDAGVALWVNGGSSNQVAKNQATASGGIGLAIAAGLAGKVFAGIVVPAEMNKATDNVFSGKTSAGILVGAGANANSVIRNTITVAAGTGIDLGADFNPVAGVSVPAASDNQVHANQLAGGDVGVLLRASTADNIVTGNQISTSAPPGQGIVQESTTNGNIVNGNPGFDPVTGKGSALGASAQLPNGGV